MFIPGRWKQGGYSRLQQIQSMVKVRQLLIVNIDKACISSKLANWIYDKAEKNHVLRIETIQQEFSTSEVKEQIEIDEEQEKNPCETFL